MISRSNLFDRARPFVAIAAGGRSRRRARAAAPAPACAETTGSLGRPPQPRRAARTTGARAAEAWGERYRANPSDPQVAIHYAQALRATGQRAQAVAVLEQASLHNAKNMEVLGAYGRALADVGNYQQALDVLGRAHAPDRPDWRILSAQGAVLDQMGRHEDAQRYYETALKIVPDEPSVLSNLGLSYALVQAAAARGGDAQARRRRPARRSAGAAESRAGGRPAGPLRGGRDASRAPTCRPRRPPPTSPICAQMLSQQSDAQTRPIREPARGAATIANRIRARSAIVRTSSLRVLFARRAARLSDEALGVTCCSAITRIAAGPRMTMNSTGRKNTIIGTVSLGGRPAAFFSASDMRMSRFSWAMTRSVVPIGRAVALRLLQGHAHRLDALEIGALGEVLVGLAAVLQIGQLGGGQRQLLGERDRLRADLGRHPLKRGLDRHAGFDADQQQIERVRERAA